MGSGGSKCAGVQGIVKGKGGCWQTPGISSHSLCTLGWAVMESSKAETSKGRASR